ncbi:MAG TPA: DUF6036 family nucleotidyltransferase [Candidatus Limnocylindria bacterium]
MADKARGMLGPERLREALGVLGEVLADRGQRFEIVVVGGAALALLGVVRRTTRDVDILGARSGDRLVPFHKLPADLAIAVRDVAGILELAENWLNAGPASLVDLGLPDGFVARLVPLELGGLVLHLAGHDDLIAFKLYAAADDGPRSKHFSDLKALDPNPDQLRSAARWARTHDTSPAFTAELSAALRALGVADDDQ